MADLERCGRCQGKGKVAGFEHVYDGVCYACRGSGRVRSRAAKPTSARVQPDPPAQMTANVRKQVRLTSKAIERLGVNPDWKAIITGVWWNRMASQFQYVVKVGHLNVYVFPNEVRHG